MVAVAYKRWSFTRGSNCKAFTGKILVFCPAGRFLCQYLWKAVIIKFYSILLLIGCASTRKLLTHEKLKVTCLFPFAAPHCLRVHDNHWWGNRVTVRYVKFIQIILPHLCHFPPLQRIKLMLHGTIRNDDF